MEKNPSSSSSARKTIEKNRRDHMKTLYSKLNSLVPHQISKEGSSLPDQLDEAAAYIRKLQAEVEKMKETKERIEKQSKSWSNEVTVDLRSPEIEVHEMGSALEVILTTGLDCQFMFNETIRLLHAEGAEVINASFSVVGDTVFHTIYSELGDSAPEYGAARLSERLKQFVYGG